MQIWDVKTGRRLHAVRAHGGFVRGVAFSPDGTQLASAGTDDTVKVWDVAAGQEVLTLRGHTSGVLGVAFSPDGTRLASAAMNEESQAFLGEAEKLMDGHTKSP
jgi:WD40 repeat protein